MVEGSEQFVTITVFAQLAGVSRQAVYSRLDSQEMSSYIQVDNTGAKPKKLLSTGALQFFKKKESCQLDSKEQPKDDNLTKTLQDQLKATQAQLTEKDRTIQALLNQVQDLTRLLDQSQQLQAMAQKQIEAPPQSEPEDIQDAPRAEPAQEKKTFFSWLFHR